MNKYEWDKTKNARNIEKHGIAFEDALTIFDGFTVSMIDTRGDYGEVREISLGNMRGSAVMETLI